MLCISQGNKLIKILKIGYSVTRIIVNGAQNVHRPLRKHMAVIIFPVYNAEHIYVGFVLTISLLKVSAMITCLQNMVALVDVFDSIS